VVTSAKHKYDTRCYFNVRSKADISQLNLPHYPTTYSSSFPASGSKSVMQFPTTTRMDSNCLHGPLFTHKACITPCKSSLFRRILLFLSTVTIYMLSYYLNNCDVNATAKVAILSQTCKVYGYRGSQSNMQPHRYGDSHATRDHTVLPATRQR